MPSPGDNIAPGAERQHYGITFAVLALAGASYAVLQSAVAPALPDIQRELHASATATAWLFTGYLLSASVLTPIVGRLGDMFGKEHTLVATLVGLSAGTLLAALANSIGVLILARVIQGAGGAIFPLAFGIIRDEFPRERVATGIGLISATFGIGGGAGLVLSGLIVDHLS
ncbi:MAG TPA: MFS transporter, partial [Solirubrobacterales bacterium]|nr:MFS transporter [Solirubrobacterales bacterium]